MIDRLLHLGAKYIQKFTSKMYVVVFYPFSEIKKANDLNYRQVNENITCYNIVFLYCAIPNTITITQFYIQDIEKDVHLERIKIQMSD